MSQDECKAEIKTYNRQQLIALWESIKNRTTTDQGWPPGIAFELLILRAFEQEGADVIWSYRVNLFGSLIEQIDGLVHLSRQNLSVLIESKDQERAMNIEPIVKMRSQLQRRPGNIIGSVFSVSGFTELALVLTQFMAPQTVLLWNGQDIEYALQSQDFIGALQLKYRYCIEQGNPVFDIKPFSS
jgi:hypothetical protein